jgi:hypothetical protein
LNTDRAANRKPIEMRAAQASPVLMLVREMNTLNVFHVASSLRSPCACTPTAHFPSKRLTRPPGTPNGKRIAASWHFQSQYSRRFLPAPQPLPGSAALALLGLAYSARCARVSRSLGKPGSALCYFPCECPRRELGFRAGFWDPSSMLAVTAVCQVLC